MDGRMQRLVRAGVSEEVSAENSDDTNLDTVLMGGGGQVKIYVGVSNCRS
jgi:hypothetical protein